MSPAVRSLTWERCGVQPVLGNGSPELLLLHLSELHGNLKNCSFASQESPSKT